MFALEIDFHDGISPPETILVRRSNAIIGSSDLAHVVVEGAASSLCELRLVRGLGREFTCLPVRRPGRGAVPPSFLEGAYPGEAELKLGEITFRVTALDLDLSLLPEEFPDRAAIRVLRAALTEISPVFPAVAVLGAKPIYVSFPREIPLLIGRSRKCGLRLDASDVSSEHARLGTEDGRCWVEDLGSTNGTYVGSERISGRRFLAPGETISIASEFLLAVVMNKEDVSNLNSQVKRYPEPALGKAYPCIVANSDAIRPVRYALRPGARITIGRDPSNDIWISAPHISRSHVELTCGEDSSVKIADHSSNGTLVRGERLPRDIPVQLSRAFNAVDLCSGVLLGICYSQADENSFVDLVRQQTGEQPVDIHERSKDESDEKPAAAIEALGQEQQEIGILSEEPPRKGSDRTSKTDRDGAQNVFERLAQRPANRAQDHARAASEVDEQEAAFSAGNAALGPGMSEFEKYQQSLTAKHEEFEQLAPDFNLLAEAEFEEDLLEGAEYGGLGRVLLMLLTFGLIIVVLFLVRGFFS